MKPSSTRIAHRHLNRRAGGRSPNQVGSAAQLKRQGYTPVDFMFGEALPHRRPLVMQGEGVQDRRGKLWLFVGIDTDGEPILAEDEGELARLKSKLVQDRLHHHVAARRASTTMTFEEVGEWVDEQIHQEVLPAVLAGAYQQAERDAEKIALEAGKRTLEVVEDPKGFARYLVDWIREGIKDMEWGEGSLDQFKSRRFWVKGWSMLFSSKVDDGKRVHASGSGRRGGGALHTITETRVLDEIRDYVETDGDRQNKGIQQILKYYRTGELPSMGTQAWVRLEEELRRILPKRMHDRMRITRKWAQAEPVAPSAEGNFWHNPERYEVRQLAETGATTNDPEIAAEGEDRGLTKTETQEEVAKAVVSPPTPTEIVEEEPGGEEFSTLNRYLIETEQPTPSLPSGEADRPMHPDPEETGDLMAAGLPSKAARRLARRFLDVRAVWKIPKPVLDFAEVIEETLLNAGVRGSVKPFNSGIVGIVIDLPRGKYLYKDQPGVVGLEDHSPGYISFGRYPDGKGLVLHRHNDRHFGDVQLTDAERRAAQQDVLLSLERILGV